MPLRLAGEEFSVVQGLDDLGWPREITVADGDPALKLDPGAGNPALSVERNGLPALRQLVAAGGAYKTLKLNATDVWELDAGAWIQGDTVIGGAGAPSPDSLLHLWKGSAGSVSALPGTLLTLESATGNGYVQFLSPSSAGNDDQGLLFGDNGANNSGAILYKHVGNHLEVTIAGVTQLDWMDGVLDFLTATIANFRGGYLQLTERADPSGPATDNALVYARDNGAGKTQLLVRFPTGAVQVLATEP